MAAEKKPWEIGKSFDHAAVLGPIHPASKTGHFTKGAISLAVNGTVKQNSDLQNMIWSVAEQIAKLSEAFELKAGDIIYSGTPENVGPVVKGDVLLVQARGPAGHVDPDRVRRRYAGQIRIFRVLAQIVHDKTAAGDDLVSVGADQLQRTLDQLRGDAAAAQRPRCLGVGDDDRRRGLAVIRERHRALDVEFETALGLVVADGGHASGSQGFTPFI